MIRLLTGSVAAAVAMFLGGMIFFASPLGGLAYSRAGDTEGAAVQAALAQNLTPTGTGTYMIPNPSGSAANTMLYARGPVATVHFNASGFPVTSGAVLLAGFVHMLIVAAIIAGALGVIGGRVTDFASRAQLVVAFTLAASAYVHLAEPIWYHHDWAYAIYLFVADAVILSVGGLVIARWFLPRGEIARGSGEAVR